MKMQDVEKLPEIVYIDIFNIELTDQEIDYISKITTKNDTVWMSTKRLMAFVKNQRN